MRNIFSETAVVCTASYLVKINDVWFNHFVWLRITDEGSLPEMRIWSILFIKCDLKWCIHLSRSLFFIFVIPTSSFGIDVALFAIAEVYL